MPPDEAAEQVDVRHVAREDRVGTAARDESMTLSTTTGLASTGNQLSCGNRPFTRSDDDDARHHVLR